MASLIDSTWEGAKEVRILHAHSLNPGEQGGAPGTPWMERKWEPREATAVVLR